MRSILIGSLAIAVVVVGIRACLPESETESNVQVILQRTDSWSDKCRQLQLRAQDGDNGAQLLLRCLTEEEDLADRYPTVGEEARSTTVSGLPIMRYERKGSTFHSIPASEWFAASSPIAASNEQSYGDISPFFWDQEKDALTFRGESVESAGTWVTAVASAPVGDHVAVLSVRGTREVGIGLPGLGRREAFVGEYYHEIRSRLTGARLGRMFRLGSAEAYGPFTLTWSLDGSYVVVASLRFDAVWVITAD